MKKKNLLMLFLSAGLVTASFAQEANTKTAGANSATSKGQSNYAVQHAKEVDQKIAAEKAARTANTAELQKKHAEEVSKKVQAEHASLTVSKSHTSSVGPKTDVKTATVTPVQTTQPKVNTIKPIRDEAAAKAYNDKMKAQKVQNAGQQKAASNTTVAKVNVSSSPGNSKKNNK